MAFLAEKEVATKHPVYDLRVRDRAGSNPPTQLYVIVGLLMNQGRLTKVRRPLHFDF